MDEHLGGRSRLSNRKPYLLSGALDTGNCTIRFSNSRTGCLAYSHRMTEASSSASITIRPAASPDAAGITRVYQESAVYHAGLDAERYCIPDAETTMGRYREGRQHPPEAAGKAVTLVAETGGEIVGFVDIRLTHSPDPMHRQMLYCHIVEIAVSNHHQGQGLGAQLLAAAEGWGREQGAEFGSLEYLAANHRAARFYERLGYRPAHIMAIKRL